MWTKIGQCWPQIWPHFAIFWLDWAAGARTLLNNVQEQAWQRLFLQVFVEYFVPASAAIAGSSLPDNVA